MAGETTASILRSLSPIHSPHLHQRIREGRRPAHVRVARGAHDVGGAPARAARGPVTERRDHYAWTDLVAHLHLSLEAAPVVEYFDQLAIGDPTRPRIAWMQHHRLLAGMSKLPRNVGVAGVEERVILRREDIQR